MAFDREDKQQKALDKIGKIVGEPPVSQKPYNQEIQEAGEEETKSLAQEQLRKATLPSNFFKQDYAKDLYAKKNDLSPE